VPAPALTLGVIAIGNAVPIIALSCLLITVCLAIVLGRRLTESASRKRLPVVLRVVSTARASEDLADLLAAGVSLVDALRATPAPGPLGVGCVRAFERAADRLERGESMSSAFDDEPVLDQEFVSVLAHAEDRGELDSVLARYSQRRLRWAERRVDRLVRLVEPVSIVVLAGIVGVLVLAAIQPILALQEVV
jgi:type IV pilus assembly protein PilC